MRIDGIYGVEEIVDRLARDDILGQLLERRDKMAVLATESGDIKLDWVDGIEIALRNPCWFDEEARHVEEILKGGIRNIIWAGMGGSVQTIYTMKGMGLLDSSSGSVFPCDNTDPQFLSKMILEIAAREGFELTETLSVDVLREIIKRTMMIGVAFGMTSEEPITHLEWFSGIMEELGIQDPGSHIQVMTIPGSFLDTFAKGKGSSMVPLQLDGENHTSGRMSAPTTRVFIRPVAFMLGAMGMDIAHGLKRIFSGIQRNYGIFKGMGQDERKDFVMADPFVALGAFVHRQVEEGRNKLVLFLPGKWVALAPWLEQLVEESIGKGGKGFLVFYGEPADPDIYGDDVIFLNMKVGEKAGLEMKEEEALRSRGHPVLLLDMGDIDGWEQEIIALGSFFSSSKLLVVSFAYLQEIPFAGQPAVEAYKAYARRLREGDNPFPIPETDHKVSFGSLTLFYNSLIEKGLMSIEELDRTLERIGGSRDDAPSVFAAILLIAKGKGVLRYLDLTYNGYLDGGIGEVLRRARLEIANKALRIRGKVRVGPSDYHSTEQSETDGPYELVSLRMVAFSHDPVIFGRYDDRFLLAQARGTWQAMEDAGRWILMMTMKDASEKSVEELGEFFERTGRILQG